MSAPGVCPPERLPTLTEVIDPSQTRSANGGEGAGGAAAASERRRAAIPVAAERRRAAAGPSVAGAAQPPDPRLALRVLEEVQRQIDVMLEYRLREAIAPALVRVADNLVREIRGELASTLRDVVARAVDEEIARHRGSPIEPEVPVR